MTAISIDQAVPGDAGTDARPADELGVGLVLAVLLLALLLSGGVMLAVVNGVATH